MKLSPTDPFGKHILLLTNMDEESKKRLQEDAESVYGSPWQLTLRDFFALSKGDLSYIGLTKSTQLKASVRQYVWMKYFEEVVQQVAAILKALVHPHTSDADRASEKCLKMGFEESTLVFVRNYFGLHSFTEAENTILSDFIIAKKDTYNNAVFQFTMNELQRQKFKTKK